MALHTVLGHEFAPTLFVPLRKFGGLADEVGCKLITPDCRVLSLVLRHRSRNQ